MATKPPAPKTAKIYKATLGSLGRVIRGEEITELEAVLERLAGRDIVVCEGGFKANRALAQDRVAGRTLQGTAGAYISRPVCAAALSAKPASALRPRFF